MAAVIEKIKAFNQDTIRQQLQYMFEGEDIDAFLIFLQNIKKFASLTPDKRHMILVDLAYFKSQIQKFEAQVKSVKEKKKLEQIQTAIKKAKSVGAKVTENTVNEYIEPDINLENIEELYNLASSWKDYMFDLYFMCGQTNKIIDNNSAY